VSTTVVGRVRAAGAALRLGWRASPRGILLQLVLALLTGVLPAVTAYVAKLLIDALAGAGGPGAAGGTRVAWLAATGAALAGATAVLNHGDNPRSLDSRTFGTVPSRTALGVALCRMSRDGQPAQSLHRSRHRRSHGSGRTA